MRVRLSTSEGGDIWLTSPYDPVFVDALKRELPYGARMWDQQQKKWLVLNLYADDLMQFLRGWGAQVHDEREAGDPAPLPAMPPELKAAYDVLFIQYEAPLCVALAAHRALAKYFHPDTGGNPEDFHRIGDAITVIRKYLDPKPETTDAREHDTDIPF